MTEFTWGGSQPATWGGSQSATWGVSQPTAPTNVSATVDGIRTVVIEWEFTSNADSAIVERSPFGSGNWTEVGTVAYPTTTFTDDDQSKLDDERYDYRVIASNSIGSSDPSAGVSSDRLPLPPVEGVAVDDISGRSATLSFTDPSNNKNGYRTLLKKPSDGSYSQDGTDIEPQYALEFPGDGSEVTGPGDWSSIGTGDYTIVAVARWDDLNRDGANIGSSVFRDNGSNVYSFNIYAGGGGIKAWDSAGGTGGIGWGSAPEGEVITVATRRTDGLRELYGDGLVRDSDTSTTDISSTGGYAIGISEDNVDSKSLDGAVERVAVFPYSLTDEEIDAFSEGIMPDGPSPLLHLGMNDGPPSAIVTDTSGNGNDGSVKGSPEWAAPLSPIRYKTTELLDGQQYDATVETFTATTTVREDQ
ncbi:LamG-like jellyroll fold domain-containing protein [Natrinema sp. DC36]|uniref:LamG-like jellyroll fold domain-containing protein n=1 Tax=Natrinema sp. DC36 TaxID=2878680 RepID=UPI001CF0914D|nr:LamG-like jellyroll fold domain-containing protein [Natrinema sp. DC36]